MKGRTIVNIDGELYPAEEARISVFDRGFLFGDSIYETMRTYLRKVFLLDQHMQRLETSAGMMHLRLPIPVPDLITQIIQTVGATDHSECYIRLIVTRGLSAIGLDTDLSARSSFVILCQQLEPLPEEYYLHGIKLVLVTTRRNDPSTVNPKMKSSNLLNNILAFREAKEQGAFEGILCNRDGYVAEGTGSNIFIVRNGMLRTPVSEVGLLEGVTRALTLKLAEDLRIPREQSKITPDELLEAEECFITSTTKEILPVSCINQVKLSPSPGPITLRLMESYRNFVQQQTTQL